MRLLAIAGLLVLAVAVVTAAACGDDDDEGDNGSATSAQMDELTTRLERVEVETALNTLRDAELHMVDEEMQQASEIPAGTAGTVEIALAITSTTTWPDELKAQASELTLALEEFMTALDADDLATAKGLSTDSHSAWHELDHTGYSWILGEEHTEDTDHGASGSPAAEGMGG
jgi:hypothetical protein